MNKLAIITVDFNGHPDTLALLESLRGLEWDGEMKVIVVDNGSREPLKDLPKDVELIQTGINLGFAGGYNRGLRFAYQWGADYFLIINNDTLVEDKNMAVTLSRVLAKKLAGAVSPKILFAPGFEFFKERYKEKDKGKVIWYAGGAFDWKNVMGVHRGIDEVDRGQYDRVEKINFISGCCVMVAREVFSKVGYLDERMFAYFEDADWMRRMGTAGYKLYYCGKTEIYHKVSQTAGVGSPMTDYLITRNRIAFAMKYAPLRTRLAILRQALGFLLFGRKTQRKGVVDWLSGKWGYPTEAPEKIYFPVKLSIGIVNYKTLDLTRKLFKSIYSQPAEITENLEVILLDNASVDGCKDMAEKEFPQVKFIQNEVNNGFAGGYNQTIDFSRGEYYLMLNSDIEALPGSLEKMLRTEEKMGGDAVLAGKLLLPDGTIQKSCFKLPTITGAIKEYFFGVKGAYSMYLPKGVKETRVEGAVMASFLIPWKIINKVGKLAEGSFMYFEDIEYCRRLKEAEVPVYFCPQATFTHRLGAASKKIRLEKAQQYQRKGEVFYHGRIKYVLFWLIYKIIAGKRKLKSLIIKH